MCGTASRARDIQKHWSDPKPVRSDDHPHGLPGLSDKDMTRVVLANNLFAYSCSLFQQVASRGVLVTMENPSSSYFWLADWYHRLQRACRVTLTDFQVCMYGGTRPKWTRIVGNFPELEQLCARCDGAHEHEPWRFATTADGSRVWATSLESKYPKQLRVAILQCILQALRARGVVLLATRLERIQTHPLKLAQSAQIAVGRQPKGSKVPHLVSDFASTAVCRVSSLSEIPCNLLSKLKHDLSVSTLDGQPATVPAASRFLKSYPLQDPSSKGDGQGPETKADNFRKRIRSDEPDFGAVFWNPMEL